MVLAPPPLVLLHGFTQTGASWRPVVERLAPPVDARCLDAPGHGTESAVRADLFGGADLVADAIGEQPALVVGYSMGGRLALRTALDHPGRVAALVLVGATAGLDDAGDRADRRRRDGELAERIERDGVESFLRAWLEQPLFAGLAPEPDDLAARRADTAEGLAASLRLMGTGTVDPPWWDDLRAIEVPTLVVWGEHDAKFAELGRRLVDAIGDNASPAVIAGAGHAAHLERPNEFAALLDGFRRDLIR